MELNANDLILKPGSRIENELCIFCGEELLAGVACEMGMHVECKKQVEKIAWKQIKDRKVREGKVKQLKIKAKPYMINKKP